MQIESKNIANIKRGEYETNTMRFQISNHNIIQNNRPINFRSFDVMRICIAGTQFWSRVYVISNK